MAELPHKCTATSASIIAAQIPGGPWAYSYSIEPGGNVRAITVRSGLRCGDGDGQQADPGRASSSTGCLQCPYTGELFIFQRQGYASGRLQYRCRRPRLRGVLAGRPETAHGRGRDHDGVLNAKNQFDAAFTTYGRAAVGRRCALATREVRAADADDRRGSRHGHGASGGRAGRRLAGPGADGVHRRDDRHPRGGRRRHCGRGRSDRRRGGRAPQQSCRQRASSARQGGTKRRHRDWAAAGLDRRPV